MAALALAAPLSTATGAQAAEVGASAAIIGALQSLETAAHANNALDCAGALTVAAQWLTWAAGDLTAAGDTEMARLAQSSAAAVQAAETQVPLADLAALAQFQATVVEGLLVSTANVFDVPLQEQLTADTAQAADANLAFWGVLGLVFTVFVSAAYIDRKQAMGGYPRGPRGVARPVVAYDYP